MRASAPAWGIASLLLIFILGLSNLFLWGRLNEIERVSQSVILSIPLQGTDATPQAVGMLVVSQDGEHGTLVVDGLPALDEMSQYQLWLIRDEQRTNGGIFSVDEEGYGNLWVSSPEPLLSYSAFGITVEPAGGSPGPTGVKVLGGEL
jgi:anti-sigma-K factor RskA